MAEKQGRGNYHSRSEKGQKNVGLRSPNGALELKNGSFRGQKTVFGGARNGFLPLNEWSVEGQWTVHCYAMDGPLVAAETQMKQILLIINQLDKYKILDFYANKKIPAQNFQILNGGDVSFFWTF